jgi:hypothetical protein
LKSANGEGYVRRNFTFEFPKGITKENYQAVFEFAKFNIIPELNKNTYTEFCGGDENIVEDEATM